MISKNVMTKSGFLILVDPRGRQGRTPHLDKIISFIIMQFSARVLSNNI